MMNELLWEIELDSAPIFATAIHNGHYIDPEIEKYMIIDEKERLREEDPFTEDFLKNIKNKLIVYRSRFQVDLNRPPKKCIYRSPEDAWGLQIYKEVPPKNILEKSLDIYNMFYKKMDFIIDSLLRDYQNIVVLDIHSYNYRRKSPDKPEPKEENPDINLGTKTLKNRDKWENFINRVIEEFGKKEIKGMKIDIRENIKFKGGYFPFWLHNRFYPNICVLSLEFKKIFMDEWSSQPYMDIIEDISKIMNEIYFVILQELEKMEKK